MRTVIELHNIVRVYSCNDNTDQAVRIENCLLDQA